MRLVANHIAAMTYDRELHHRQSIRWQDHDYAAGDTYFVTVCPRTVRACLAM